METQQPYLISTFDVVLEQIFKLIKDIETHKWDAGVTVMVKNGTLDIRGLGVVDTTPKAAALLFAAFKSLPPASQSEMMAEMNEMMKRSDVIEKEAPLWKPKPELRVPISMPTEQAHS